MKCAGCEHYYEHNKYISQRFKGGMAHFGKKYCRQTGKIKKIGVRDLSRYGRPSWCPLDPCKRGCIDCGTSNRLNENDTCYTCYRKSNSNGKGWKESDGHDEYEYDDYAFCKMFESKYEAFDNEVKYMNVWVLMDSDNSQYIKQNSNTEFSTIGMTLIDSGKRQYEVYTDTIDLKEFLETKRDELVAILETFDYESIEAVKNRYKNANQIMAQCVFKYYGTVLSEPLFKGSQTKCMYFISNYTK